jgi:hypothetical protein
MATNIKMRESVTTNENTPERKLLSLITRDYLCHPWSRLLKIDKKETMLK